MRNLELLVTLWPTFSHFDRFVMDPRVKGIRLNSAMVNKYTFDKELDDIKELHQYKDLYLDIKGRQLRVTRPIITPDHLELELNYPIKVETPTMVLFKAGEDYALLKEVKDGNRLIFEGGPEYLVHEGESLHIRHPSLAVEGPFYNNFEIEKIQKAKAAGFDKWFLSYVENQQCIDEFRKYVGDDHVIAKIENKKGLEYVANDYQKADNLSLMAARGDLYVEVDKPHHILQALKLIVEKDPNAYAGSRMLLSAINRSVPDCADLSELAWLYDIGYNHLMLCDELCLEGGMLGRAVNVFDSFRKSYVMGLGD